MYVYVYMYIYIYMYVCLHTYVHMIIMIMGQVLTSLKLHGLPVRSMENLGKNLADGCALRFSTRSTLRQSGVEIPHLTLSFAVHLLYQSGW